jgi:hypothetical protein
MHTVSPVSRSLELARFAVLEKGTGRVLDVGLNAAEALAWIEHYSALGAEAVIVPAFITVNGVELPGEGPFNVPAPKGGR